MSECGAIVYISCMLASGSVCCQFELKPPSNQDRSTEVPPTCTDSSTSSPSAVLWPGAQVYSSALTRGLMACALTMGCDGLRSVRVWGGVGCGGCGVVSEGAASHAGRARGDGCTV